MNKAAPLPTRPDRDPEADRRLLRVQALSGSVFLLFALVHLANAALAARGVGAYQGWLGAARTIYQQPIVELGLLMLPLAVHRRVSCACGGTASDAATAAFARDCIDTAAGSCSSSSGDTCSRPVAPRS